MKICITSVNPSLDSPVDLRFGRSPFFLILDEEGNLKEHLLNPGINAGRGAGIAAAQLIVSKGVNVLITANLGPNAGLVLFSTGIKIFAGPINTTVRQAFEMWKENKLSAITAPSVAGGFGFGHGRGGGRGRGRGML